MIKYWLVLTLKVINRSFSSCLTRFASFCRLTVFGIQDLDSTSTRLWPHPPSSRCPVKIPSSLPSDWAGNSKSSARYGYRCLQIVCLLAKNLRCRYRVHTAEEIVCTNSSWWRKGSICCTVTEVFGPVRD